MPAFRLQKWYLDCVTTEGQLLIVYLARLHWGRLTTAYGATLELAADGTVRQRQVFRRGTLTRIGDHLVVEHRRLGLLGVWTGISGTGPQVLHEADGEHLTWESLALTAKVDAHCRDGRYTGTGYAEVVTLTVPPWRLPFDNLVWGRFVADDAASGFTWIQWRDAAGDLVLDRTWGHPTDAPEPLRLAATREVRSGPVMDVLLGRLARLDQAVPTRLRSLEEDKRLSRGTLHDGTAGWVVHEEVRGR